MTLHKELTMTTHYPEYQNPILKMHRQKITLTTLHPLHLPFRRSRHSILSVFHPRLQLRRRVRWILCLGVVRHQPAHGMTLPAIWQFLVVVLTFPHPHRRPRPGETERHRWQTSSRSNNRPNKVQTISCHNNHSSPQTIGVTLLLRHR